MSDNGKPRESAGSASGTPAGACDKIPAETKTLSAAEIAEYLGQPHTAGSLAAGVAMFWPTIKEALLAYDKQTNGKKVEPIKQDW